MWDPNFRPAVSLQWNLTVQHQFGGATTLQASYVGQKNDNMVTTESYYQKILLSNGTVLPSPYLAGNPVLKNEISTISGESSNANGTYHALQVTLQRKFSQGLQFQAAYTYSKCLTDSVGFYGDSGQASAQAKYVQNEYNRRADWGPCYYDLPHNGIARASYDLPFGRNGKFGRHLGKALDRIVTGWQLNGIVSIHGGFPLTITASDNSGTTSQGARANCLAPATVFGNRDSSSGGYQWFDPTAFASASKGTFGTCGVGTVRGPGLYSADLGISRFFKIREFGALEFRGEFINATNKPILNAPTSSVGSKLGLIQSSQGARNIQVALKYRF